MFTWRDLLAAVVITLFYLSLYAIMVTVIVLCS